MEDFIEDLYKKAYIVPRLKELVTYAYRQDGFYVQKIWKEVAPLLAEICGNYGEVYSQDIESNALFKCTEEVVDAGVDISLIGSKVESKIIPLLEKLFQTYAIDVTSEDGRYTIKSSSSGFLTLYDSKRGIYIHSTSDPVTEAKELAKYIYKPEYSEIAVLGMGMGYLPWELWNASHGAVKVTVFEDNDDLLFYASHYGVLDYIPEDCICIIKAGNAEATVEAFLEYNKQDCGKYANWWYLNGTGEEINERTRETLKLHSLKNSVVYRDNTLFEINFWNNTRIVKKFATELKDELKPCNEWVLVAGGPSVDENIDYLKDSIGKRTIISVITSVAKLVAAGVKPDIIVATDMHEAEYRHFVGILDESIPLIMAPTLYWKCVKDYKGDKYLAPIVSNGAMAIKMYKSGVSEWSSGYSVSVLTLESAIRLGAKTLYLVGTDFSYPGGYSHAVGTAYREKVKESESTFQVDSNDGGKVLTSEDLNMFRLEFERVLRSHTDCKVINLSKHGARIEGTIVGD